MPPSYRTNKARAALARTARHGRDPEKYAAAARVYYEYHIEDLVRENLAKAPPLHPEQIERLVAIFRNAPTAPADGGTASTAA